MISNEWDVLFLDDIEMDAELVHQKLLDELGAVHLDWASSEAEYLKFIQNKTYDVILADYTLPGYNAEGALKSALSFCPQTPFICVSGTIGEDIAVELLKQGASDYVLKDRLGRLTFAMKRAIEEAEKINAYEQALKASEESYRLMCDSSNDGIAMYDKDGVILNINAVFEKRYGISKKELVGRNFRSLIPDSRYDDLGEKRMNCLNKVFMTGEIVEFEDTKDGLTFNNRFHPVFTDGKVSAVTLFSTDITDSRKATQEEQKNKFLTEFFTNITHDLKTPLSVILIQLEMMKYCMDNKEKATERIKSLTQNAYRLTRLIENLLDLTKIDAGHLMPKYAREDMVALLKNLCEFVEVYAKNRSIQIILNCQPTDKPMLLDTDKTERIVLNLLSNAIKNTPKGGIITINLNNREDGGVILSVKDTGVGIPQDQIASVFERFTQLSNGPSRQSTGSGIGLALVKSLVELLGGTVRVCSIVGQGSEFIVELPLVEAEYQTKIIELEGYQLSKKVAMELSDIDV